MQSSHQDEQIKNYYKFEDELGRGAFSIVTKATHRKTGKKYAVKIIDRSTLEDDDEIALQ